MSDNIDGTAPPFGGAADRTQGPAVEVVINGETRTVLQGTTVAALIAQLGFGDRRVAVERNREVVPRAQHGSTVLASGDQLELVTFVGGG